MKVSDEMLYIEPPDGGDVIPVPADWKLNMISIKRGKAKDGGGAGFWFEGHGTLVDKEQGVKSIMSRIGSPGAGMVPIRGTGKTYLVRPEDVESWPVLYGAVNGEVVTVRMKFGCSFQSPVDEYRKFLREYGDKGYPGLDAEKDRLVRNDRIKSHTGTELSMTDVACVEIRESRYDRNVIIYLTLTDGNRMVSYNWSDLEYAWGYPGNQFIYAGCSESYGNYPLFVNARHLDLDALESGLALTQGSDSGCYVRITNKFPVRKDDGTFMLFPQDIGVTADEIRECISRKIPVPLSRIAYYNRTAPFKEGSCEYSVLDLDLGTLFMDPWNRDIVRIPSGIGDLDKAYPGFASDPKGTRLNTGLIDWEAVRDSAFMNPIGDGGNVSLWWKREGRPPKKSYYLDNACTRELAGKAGTDLGEYDPGKDPWIYNADRTDFRVSDIAFFMHPEGYMFVRQGHRAGSEYPDSGAWYRKLAGDPGLRWIIFRTPDGRIMTVNLDNVMAGKTLEAAGRNSGGAMIYFRDGGWTIWTMSRMIVSQEDWPRVREALEEEKKNEDRKGTVLCGGR